MANKNTMYGKDRPYTHALDTVRLVSPEMMKGSISWKVTTLWGSQFNLILKNYRILWTTHYFEKLTSSRSGGSELGVRYPPYVQTLRSDMMWTAHYYWLALEGEAMSGQFPDYPRRWSYVCREWCCVLSLNIYGKSNCKSKCSNSWCKCKCVFFLQRWVYFNLFWFEFFY